MFVKPLTSCSLIVVLMLLNLYSKLSQSSNHVASKPLDDEERSIRTGNGSIVMPSDRQAHDAQEFELEGLMSDDDEESHSHGKENGKLNGGPPRLR
jgi:hypothetical protein